MMDVDGGSWLPEVAGEEYNNDRYNEEMMTTMVIVMMT